MSELVAIKTGPNSNCVAILEMALQEAREGKLSGVVILGDGPGNYCDAFEGGDYSLGNLMYVYECWKTRAIEKKLKGPTL